MAETLTLELTRGEIAAYLVGLAVVEAKKNVVIIRRHGADVFLKARPESELLLDHQKVWLTNALDDEQTQGDAEKLETSARAAGGPVEAPWSD